MSLCALGPDSQPFTVSGQTAKTLKALVAAGGKGVTALECGAWAFRLAAYVAVLRKLGLAIETMRERHNDWGDWHGRYVLHSSVTIEGTGQ